MPHKKAKRTVREKLRNEAGTDLAPGKDSLRNEPMPKSAARVFNSQAVRDEYKLKKRKREEEGEQAAKKQKTGNAKSVALKIQPGESMQHFNRRVEDDLRPLVKTAVQTSRAVARSTAKAEHEARIEAKKARQEKNKPKEVAKSEVKARNVSPPAETDKFKDRKKEFNQAASSSAPRRLNDIAQAPPEFKKLPRGVTSAIGKRDGVLSMSQKVMLEQEREKVIARYRELKASRINNGDKDEGKDDE